MANTNAANGFLEASGSAASPTYELTQMAIAYNNANPIFQNDPVMPAANATGIASGLICQGYPPVVLTVGATGLSTNATGVLTITLTAVTTGLIPTSPTAWAPPVGSLISVVGATPPTLDGVYQVASATTTTAVNVAQSSVPASTTSTASGVVTLYTPVVGVFSGCKYLSVSQKRTVWSNYWPGSDGSSAGPTTPGTVTAYVINSQLARFNVQTGNSTGASTAVGITNVGLNASFHYNIDGASTATNGVTANGLSSFFIDSSTIASTPYLPFRIIGLVNYTPDGSSPFTSVNGNDATTKYNRIIVGFNSSALGQLTGV